MQNGLTILIQGVGIGAAAPQGAAQGVITGLAAPWRKLARSRWAVLACRRLWSWQNLAKNCNQEQGAGNKKGKSA
jgi:hypothetical protein